jgi:hypothetical protein
MVFTLCDVAIWGRSYAEYVSMFALTGKDLRGRILGCGDGPASFNQDLTKKGGKIVSVDPVYVLSREEIRDRIDRSYTTIMEQLEKNQNEYVWTYISSMEDLGRIRTESMERFLGDYPAGLKEGRYKAASLPVLPFDDGEFDLALCSHLLFLYSLQLSFDFHVSSLKELCRVAEEVRIFPLLELGAVPSRHLAPVMEQLICEGYTINIRKVPFEFQKGATQMMTVRRPMQS